MAITRTAITDDDGTGTTGTVLNAAWKTELYDQIDAITQQMVAQSTTSTGTVNDFSLTSKVSELRLNNASLLTLQGLTAGADGQVVDLISVGAGQVDLVNQSSGSSAANRIINGLTGKISLAAGSGRARLIYDGTTARWRVVNFDQGAWITPTFAAGDYTPSTGTWTVESGDVGANRFRLDGKMLTFSVRVDTTTVATNPGELRVTIPNGYTAVTGPNVQDAAIVFDNSTTVSDVGVASVASGTSFVAVFLKNFATWAAATNTTGLRFTVAFEVA